MAYYQFTNENCKPYGSCEVFHHTPHVNQGDDPPLDEEGWFWWACWPGCLPDGEPSGPFETEEEAMKDANAE